MIEFETLTFLAAPFAACLVLVGMHAYLGIHVLARGVIFIDIALAQVAALGTTVAFLVGYPLDGVAATLTSLGFTFVAAGIFALTRGGHARVSQEAVIGITYVVAAAAAVVFVDDAPRGAEHIKYLLVGNLLWVTPWHVAGVAALYAGVGSFHWLFRERFLALSRGAAVPRAALWDLLFYLSFGLVITSSVQIAGVLLVFTFLIAPAVFAALFTDDLRRRLLLSWTLGFLVSIVGITASYALDLPTGAAVVACFGVALVVGLAARGLAITPASSLGLRP